MLLHVELGQFDTDGEALNDEDDAGELDGDNVDIAPGLGVDEVGGMRAEDDTAKSGDGGFTNVHALLDDGGAKHEKRSEAAKNDVDQVRLGDRKMIPSHDGELVMPLAGPSSTPVPS